MMKEKADIQFVADRHLKDLIRGEECTPSKKFLGKIFVIFLDIVGTFLGQD